jgi:hypothetical protein
MSAALSGAPSGLKVMPRALVSVLAWVWPLMREVREMLYQNDQDYVFDCSDFMAHAPDFRITPLERGLAETFAQTHRASTQPTSP